MNKSSKTPFIVAAVAALLIGGGVGYGAGMGAHAESHNTATASNSKTMEPVAPAADLRVGMNNLLREHVSSSLDVTRSIVDDAPQAEIDASIAAQMGNAGDIAAAVGSVYGKEAQDKLTEMFVEHIEESNNFAHGVAAGDEAAKQAAVVELNEYLNEIAGFFSGAIKDLPKDTAYSLLEEHESLLNQSVEAYQAGDFAKSYELERKALTQVSTIADALSAGIVATKPEKFNQ